MDVVVVGSGPNGLSAAIALAQQGLEVVVFEADSVAGGGTRSGPLTLEGYLHDLCSAVHPMGVLSPFWRTLPLAEHGLEWAFPQLSVAHPLDGGRAATLSLSVDETAERLGRDAGAYRRLVSPFVDAGPELLADLMAPLGKIPGHPVTMARFGLAGGLPASLLARAAFSTPEARALLAGLAGHSILPLEAPLSGAVGLIFAVTAHLSAWPVAVGGSQSIARALVALFESLRGRVQLGSPVRSLAELPPSRAVIFDTSPGPMADIAGDALPDSYRRRLRRYRYGPGTFKVDYALDGPIPWAAADCARASTIHVGGTLEEIADAERAPWRGRVAERPYLIVCQQSHFDPSRAPESKHTGYAYCHVPSGCTVDMTDAIEAQIERFAPGFRDRVLARHVWSPADFERHNPNYVGGAITGGAADATQLFTRPVARLDPYSTPNPRLFIASASTPPGGGVHGMCGWHAAQSVLRRLGKR
ncbi:MAG: NAD(P)/FAD-dependent oxidoreductase [Myxococcales bacterium]|nr:NAD(P)/FAD-dependent oxidoreductase [Myxococcales bacterium]MCB9521486.1 NAD(P)/FAD-dependent oxidoreductase [Myxococcales bacterium]MCB9531768.1 NAD(P)/FAD-dependent oxidoreductase [Myxococcales bacterium]